MLRVVFAGFAVLCWSALTAAELGIFRGGWVLIAGVVAAAIAWFLRPLAPRETPPGPREGLTALAIALLSLGLAWPPGESILGGWDPGVYIHTGAAISRDGELPLDLPDLRELSKDEKKVLLKNHDGILGPYGGMWLMADGRLSPQFFHLYPSLLAVAHTIGGLRLMLAVNPLLHTAAVLLFFIGVRRWFPTTPALVATAVFALNPAQIWQAGFSTAEPMTQVLLLFGFIFLDRALAPATGNKIDAAFAGIALGLSMLARYDALMFVVPLVVILLALKHEAASKMPIYVLLAVLVPLCAQVVIHQHAMTPYYHPMSHAVQSVLGWGSAALLAHLVLLSFAPWRKVASFVATWVRPILALGFVGGAAYAWFVRPEGAATDPEAANFLYLVDLLGAPLLALALVGVASTLVKARALSLIAPLYAAVAVMAVLTVNLFNDHFLMWVSRRFVPVVLPLLALGVGACVALVAARFGARGQWVTVAVIALSFAPLVPSTLFVAKPSNWPGLAGWYDEVAANIPERSMVVSDQPGFAAPLRFLWNRRAYELHVREDDRRERLANVFAARCGAGEDVLFLSMEGPINDPRLTFTNVGSFPLVSTMQKHQPRGIPREAIDLGGPFALYRVTLAR